MTPKPTPVVQRLGPRPRPDSPHVRDAVISLSRRPTAHAVWLGKLGVLFNQGTMLAVYRPSTGTVEYNARATTPQLRHVYQWAHELRTEAFPVPHVDDNDSFVRGAITDMAAAMDDLNRAFNNPSRSRRASDAIQR